jgi:hypothetical protein
VEDKSSKELKNGREVDQRVEEWQRGRAKSRKMEER